ncbi:MAG: toll/interleukin-1 receptor domain-containing protein [Novosphingobium sp.]|jgi:hypothetical protein|uniref:toll/interleukin-1 receptor domain-containing protein n=1 Tax=Novosphingobium sp. TaxID=1874826 RepID=UPI003015FB1C
MDKAAIFISYSNWDVAFVKDQGRGKPFFTRALERVRRGNCTLFISGFETDEWKPEVEEALNRTHIFIPLISDDFLASKSCAHEVEIVRGRKERGEAVAIVPFLYRYCLYDDVEWLAKAPVHRGPGEFYSAEFTEHDREHFIIHFRNKIEAVLDRLEADCT